MPAATSIFIAATVASIGLQYRQQKKVEKAQKKEAAVERAAQSEEAARRRRAVIKEAAIKQAQIQNIAGFTGQTESSAVLASEQQIAGQTGTALKDVQTGLGFAQARTSARQETLSAQQVSPLQQIASATQQGAIAFKS